jgi:5-methylcytosine-specific restriction endonuclease McrA
MFFALLLNSTYECISFISERKIFKFILKDKVEILANWDEQVFWPSGSMNLPAVLRLKSRVNHRRQESRFNKNILFMRDSYRCQYCNRKVHKTRLTIDHIIPKCKGGGTTWDNCVACCAGCNNKKGNKTLQEVGFKLIKKPKKPKTRLFYDHILIKNKHNDWRHYINY